MPKVGGKRVI